MPVPFPARHGPASGASSAVLPPRSGVAFFRASGRMRNIMENSARGGQGALSGPSFWRSPLHRAGASFHQPCPSAGRAAREGYPSCGGTLSPPPSKPPACGEAGICVVKTGEPGGGGAGLHARPWRSLLPRSGLLCKAPSSLWRGPAREGKRRPGRSFPGMGKLRLFHTVVDGRDVFSRCGRFLPYAEKKRLRAAKDGMPRVMPRAGDCKGSRRRRCGHE